ncbi:MAG: VanZ family protein [Gemmatimonadales bacterium]
MVLVFLVPVPRTPLLDSDQFDKAVHFGIFLGFALLFYLDRPSRIGWMLLTSFAFAGGIELLQWVLPYREGDWGDFVAGALGAGLGGLLVLTFEPRTTSGGKGPSA